MLSFHGYSKSYNTKPILSIDKLTLSPGIHWIKGHNGSGKSTLFKSIAGLIPFAGQIVLNGMNLREKPIEFRRAVNFSEAEPIYPEFLTAKDLVRFVGRTKNASHENQSHVTAHFGVSDFFNSSCGTFSSGMLKKLSLSMGFLGDPTLIILDEPFITLDQHARGQLVRFILDYSSRGVMFLISSHQEIEGDIPWTTVFTIEDQKLVHA